MVVVVEEVGGTAPGLPGPEVAFEVGWSSSSSEEPPVYATKPVFSLFTAGAKRARREQKKKQEKRERERKAAHVERRKRKREKTYTTTAAAHFKSKVIISNTCWEKQKVNRSNVNQRLCQPV